MRVAKKNVLSLIMRGLRWRTDNDLRFTLNSYLWSLLTTWLSCAIRSESEKLKKQSDAFTIPENAIKSNSVGTTIYKPTSAPKRGLLNAVQSITK